MRARATGSRTLNADSTCSAMSVVPIAVLSLKDRGARTRAFRRRDVRAAGLPAARFPEQRLDVPADRRQRRSELMSDCGEKLIPLALPR